MTKVAGGFASPRPPYGSDDFTFAALDRRLVRTHKAAGTKNGTGIWLSDEESLQRPGLERWKMICQFTRRVGWIDIREINGGLI